MAKDAFTKFVKSLFKGIEDDDLTEEQIMNALENTASRLDQQYGNQIEELTLSQTKVKNNLKAIHNQKPYLRNL